ncbi:outer membrane protein assembly factor BamB family protein [Halegenticoccus tardaugens]|uniref:outer membrane protein assembly factor BamB family protein n=1 Tax=Halegenticoccus tardaugens TaxID=2071624 RepID=UPI00100C1393|nr:PQQ-binding-like beta-propeller repeat protein [Halegenticoccus tardaugens]
MRPRTVAVIIGFVIILGGIAFVAAYDDRPSDVQLIEQWVSDTSAETSGNHHAPAAGRIEGRGMVYAPVSGQSDTKQCNLVAIDASNGTERWSYQIPPKNCTIHSVADPMIADYDDDGTAEVLAATTERSVVAFDPTTGQEEFRYDLSAYGYTRPVVTDFTGDSAKEVIIVDVKGSVSVVRADGTLVWTKRLSSYAWGQPTVADFTGNGDAELMLGLGNGDLALFESDGSIRWRLTSLFDSSITWQTAGDIDNDSQSEIIVATADGTVAAVNGRTGDVEWRQHFGALAAVRDIGDGDGDGDPEVYAVARDGKLRSLDAKTGEVEWTTTLTTGDIQMTPPPSLGDVDGDGSPELVAVTNDGIVSVVDPTSGDVLDSYTRDVSVYTHPTLADTDGDGVPEIYVIYSDGRVVALSAAENS